VRLTYATICSLFLSLGAVSAHAALFEDEEARRAILDLRQRVESSRVASEQAATKTNEDVLGIRRSLLDLQNQIEMLRSDMAKLRGQNEQMTRELSDTQMQQKNITQTVDERLRPLEPVKVTVDGREFTVEPLEKREFDAALATFRKGDFATAQTAFSSFLKRFSLSGYRPSVLFWIGNAQYATRDYKEAMANFRTLIVSDPEHVRVPEAVLSIANCQVELKDNRGARKTLEDLIKAYPQSEAAVAAKERLARLK
jgi:tol-pal system protein YbgF